MAQDVIDHLKREWGVTSNDDLKVELLNRGMKVSVRTLDRWTSKTKPQPPRWARAVQLLDVAGWLSPDAQMAAARGAAERAARKSPPPSDEEIEEEDQP